MFDKIQEIYWKIIPYDYRPLQIIYRIKCKFWIKYTTIKSRYLDDTYCDCVELLPQTMFEILSRFIEKECSPGHVDWEGSDHTVKVNGKKINVRKEMQYLYDWWHNYYNKERIKIDNDLYEEYQKYSPTLVFEPIEGVSASKLIFKYDSQEYDIKYHEYIDKSRKKEAADNKELINNMKRLVNLTPFLWT
jgi:hypothetical protein